MQKNHLYTPFYCEENIWHLCQEPELKGDGNKVVFIFNAQRSCALWWQRACESVQYPVVWDYHVILLHQTQQYRWEVWDLDTTLGLPVEVARYTQATFRCDQPLGQKYAPLFRTIAADQYVRDFSSDRTHMLDASGHWQAPPPVWAPIIQSARPNFLCSYVDSDAVDSGNILDLPGFVREYGG